MSALSIIIFIVGVILLIVEMCTPGFGVAGGLGLVCLVVDIFITAKTFTQGLIMTGIVAVIVVILAVVSIVLVSKGKMPASLMLKDATDKASGYTGGSDTMLVETNTYSFLPVIRLNTTTSDTVEPSR